MAIQQRFASQKFDHPIPESEHLFPQMFTTIVLNTHYLILLRNSRDDRFLDRDETDFFGLFKRQRIALLTSFLSCAGEGKHLHALLE